MNTSSDVLNKAADLIERRGWTKGSIGMCADGSSPLCVEGAIGDVLELSAKPWWRDASVSCFPMHLVHDTAALKALRDYLPMAPFLWNDAPERTKAEVIEVLRAAAVVEAARESAPASVAVSA